MLKISTKRKVAAARLLSRAVCLTRKAFGRPATGVFERGGLRYDLDLSEGIDLAIYLFGAFEKEVAGYCRRVLREGDYALDVGANIGAHSLNMARIVGPAGLVVACEPTNFAFEKLKRNLALNPSVAARVEAKQVFLASSMDEVLPEGIPSSWPLALEQAELVASQGVKKPTCGASVSTLDAIVTTHRDAPLRLLKIDVDGYELDVLRGGGQALSRHHPAIILELAPYSAAAGEGTMLHILGMLRDCGYQTVTHVTRSFPITDSQSILARIPRNGSINVLIL